MAKAKKPDIEAGDIMSLPFMGWDLMSFFLVEKKTKHYAWFRRIKKDHLEEGRPETRVRTVPMIRDGVVILDDEPSVKVEVLEYDGDCLVLKRDHYPYWRWTGKPIIENLRHERRTKELGLKGFCF